MKDRSRPQANRVQSAAARPSGGRPPSPYPTGSAGAGAGIAGAPAKSANAASNPNRFQKSRFYPSSSGSERGATHRHSGKAPLRPLDAKDGADQVDHADTSAQIDEADEDSDAFAMTEAEADDLRDFYNSEGHDYWSDFQLNSVNVDEVPVATSGDEANA